MISRRPRRLHRLGAGLLLALLSPARARGWIYSEHRAITARGIETLDPRRQVALDELWGLAREGHTSRLCAVPRAGDQGGKPACIDLAAWPSVNGDHSCSPDEMLRVILSSDWILRVAQIAEKTGASVARARNESEVRNAQMNGDLGLERADLGYSTRAGANNAHHALPRSNNDANQYVVDALRAGVEPNVVGLYLLFHAAALSRAAVFPADAESPAERAAEARLILALEAFALHFLEDAYAAGHIAGSWGPTAVRKGTHDYYSEHGIDTDTWENEPVTVYGDGHMRPPDLERAGEAVRLSLGQVLDALDRDSRIRCDAATIALPPEVANGTLDVCRTTAMPGWTVPPELAGDFLAVLRTTPRPVRGSGYASLPRFRAEIGPFVGIASGVQAEGADGGFGAGRTGGAVGSLDVGLRLGYGLDALLGDSGDGQVFVQGGIVLQSRSTGGCGSDCPTDPLFAQFVPGLPARSALSFRVRLPFWLVPGDLLLAAPVMALTDPGLLEKMAIVAADGGLVPWQTKLSTPIGSLQFVAGREVAVNLFGYLGGKDAFLAVSGRTADGAPIFEPVAFRSIEWDFPVLELRPLREYGTRYSFSTLVQFGAGFDTPISAQSLVPGQPVPALKTRYFGFVRVFFDGRRYF
ncbi:MAG TPA: hypothetical protein VN032_08370 [Thermoanaerobaculia bacterium]|nr:hypothetical protein [Thermoanaerobaculia bacterium]